MTVKISGFSFVHNALDGGYPIVEAIKSVQPYVDEVVVVDMQSTDGTRELLECLKVKIVDGVWRPSDGKSVDCLNEAHALNVKCSGDIIIHFEADEVYDPQLINVLELNIRNHGIKSAKVARTQVCQNFQRIRWYPWPVHRVFEPGTVTKAGHTTKEDLQGDNIVNLGQEFGMLWDVTFCFRDNLRQRIANSRSLYGEAKPGYKFVPPHFAQKWDLDEVEFEELLNQPHWEYQTTFINIPNILKRLIGITDYKKSLKV